MAKTSYRYKTVPVEYMLGIAAGTDISDIDADLYNDDMTRDVIELLNDGWRWVRTEVGFAILEKASTDVKDALLD